MCHSIKASTLPRIEAQFRTGSACRVHGGREPKWYRCSVSSEFPAQNEILWSSNLAFDYHISSVNVNSVPIENGCFLLA
jgi:hypothetical protein